MKNIDIVRGYRTFAHEDLYDADATVEIVPGNIINLDGTKATLGTEHKEVAVALESNKDISGNKPSGKIPVCVSNFTVRYYKPVPEGVNLGDPVTVVNGEPSALDDNHKVVWGYVTKISETSFDVRVNY
jgi:hypothetical protein